MKELQEAVKHGDFQKMRRIVEEHGVERFYDVNVNTENAAHINLFHYMIQREEFSMVRFLVEQGWDVNQRDSNGNPTVLYVMGCFNEKMQQYVLEKGLDVNMRTKRGSTAILEATWIEAGEVVKWLFLNGADPNIRDKEGENILQSMSKQILRYMLPTFLKELERWDEENLKFLKVKRMELLFK